MKKPASGAVVAKSSLRADDLIPDRALLRGDRDDFRHSAIAQRLADLVTESDTPMNVALFGSWGSGKSSTFELLRRALEARPERVRLVRYDAWKYGGESLQRNFISHAANELGFREKDRRGEAIRENREFHRGLYEKQRRADVDFRDLSLRRLAPVVLFAAVFALVLVAFALVAGFASFLTDESFLGQIGTSLPKFLAPAGVVGAIVAVAKGVLDGATVDVEQSQPAADEEFSRVFGILRDRALDKWSRVVFFVDELDRCAPDDVVKTLTALRTFLDQDDCVVIVAADREVLEKALVALPQATPFNEENPYYSSASSFLDKVFQHQLPLPPLRGRRLTRFARDLVRDRGGLWGELRVAEPNGRLLDRVIYALIPGHVRSPRRVKVLLNNFATNARIAQSRDVDWLGRAREIAKLTVLQTEFPLLATDLQHEPRLPTFLLRAPLNPSDRVSRLLRKHGGARIRAEEGPLSEPALTDAPLSDAASGADGSAKARVALAVTERRLLLRYLQRAEAAGISDPGRDLLYLEAAGAAVGFDDPELGELIETEAPEAPQALIDAVHTWSVQQQRAAVRVLADMADQEFGDEQANVMRALLGIVGLLGSDAIAVAESALEAVKSFMQEQELHDDLLMGTLDLALHAEPSSASALTDVLFDDPRLFSSAARVGEVAAMLDLVPIRHQPAVYEQVAAHLTEVEVLRQPLQRLPTDAALALLESSVVRDGLETAVEETDPETFSRLAESLYAGAEQRTDGAERVLVTLQNGLVRFEPAYSVVRVHADAVLAMAEERERTTVGLVALHWSPVEDWRYWTGKLTPAEDVGADDTRAAVGATRSILTKVNDADENQAAAGQETIQALRPFLTSATDEEQEEVEDAVATRLASREWWEGDDTRAAQTALHGVILPLAAVPSGLGVTVVKLLVADVTRALTATVVVRRGLPEQAVDQPATLRGIREMGSALPSDGAAKLLAELAELAAPSGSERLTTLTKTRIAVATAAVAGGESFDPAFVPLSDVLELDVARDKEARASVAAWLRLSPPLAQVLAFLTHTRGRPARPLPLAVGDWAASLDIAQRTEVVGQLLKSEYEFPDWIRAVSQHGVDDEPLMTDLAGRVARAGNRTQRETAVDLVVALAPTSAGGQRKVADIIEGLLRRGTRVDFMLACRATAALGNRHRSGDRLKRAFVDARDRHGHQVPAMYLASLSGSGINLPQKSITETARDTWRRLRGK
ncbi:MAG: P-loop NTPase fold protein [Tepidisphaeraceae bacterium]